MIMRKTTFLLMLLLTLNSAFTQDKYLPTKENIAQREWFQNAKFSPDKKNPKLNFFQVNASQSLKVRQEK